MGRAKVVMEAIKDDKKRNITFQRRKENIIKKALELTTLCDVNVSIILSTDQDQKPQIFPQDSHKLDTLIDLYRRKRTGTIGSNCSSNVSDFFINRKIKIEEELAKAKKKNLEAKYPTWFDFLNDFSEGQLREFALGLGRKIDHVQTKIDQVPLKKSSIPKNLDPIMMPMDYNDDHVRFDHSVNNLMIEQQLKLVTELLMNDDDDDFYNYERLFDFQPPPPQEAAAPATAVNNGPFSMSDIPTSQMMEYDNNFGYDPVELFCGDHQCDFFINQPSNPCSDLMEMLMRKDGNNNCCNYDQNFGVQPPSVVYSFPPPPPPPQMIVQQPEAPPVMHMNNPFFKSG
ncbi:hypothetical protein L6452_25755 [Arctium lappa]|uniref:Uncharacterized protein n=1 Tax=Arctium lappa TaxID=4217 RepID=A0ACB9AAU5_ARCLA|nr:hypothetical protein L6452_25755 [Arctium lappa]